MRKARFLLRGAVAMAAGFGFALPANAATREIIAFCMTSKDGSNIMTNIAPVAVPSDLTYPSAVDKKLPYIATQTMISLGLNIKDNINCAFFDPTMRWEDGNLPMDELQRFHRLMASQGYQLRQVSRLDGSGPPSSIASPSPKTNRQVANNKPPAEKSILAPVAKGPTPNQLKYQRELAEYQQRLADIERVKAAAQAKLASDKASAQLVIEQHRQETDINRQQVVAAERAKRQYEQELAAQQAQATQMRTKQDREALADWREAVAVCELNAQDPQSKFGNWRCEGPLQFTYAKLGNGGQSDLKAMASVSDACGGKVESVRDLAMVGGYRVFGCSFGLHPKSEQRLAADKAVKFGLAYIPGRIIYRCPTYVSYCRTR